MKKYMMMAALAAATISLTTSCSDEEMVKMSTKEGEPIRFTAVTKQAVETRTAYSTTTHEKNGKQYWDLYWVENDEVTIHCPEAQATEESGHSNTAEYTVEGKSAADMTVSYSITGEGLYWGKDETHHFFEAYPSKNVTEIKDGVLTATLPSSQTLRKQDDGTYADMEAALMAGTTSIDKSAINSGSTINLPFKPIFTAVDITISAADNQDFVIHSITVANVEDEENPAPLAGKFYYNYATEAISEVSDADMLYNVQAEFPKGIILSNTSTEPTATKEAKVTVFLRGDFNKPVKIVLNATSVNTETGEETHGFFKKQGTASDALTAKARNHIKAGKLPTAKLQAMTGEWWVSHMHNATYVSQLSLPGAYDAGNFGEKVQGCDRAQTALYKDKGYSDNYYGQMSEYLNHGIRVLDFQLSCLSDKDGVYWQSDRIANTGRSEEKLDFEKMVTAADEWLAKHTTEFLIFVMRDYEWNNANSLYKANINDLINKIPANRLLTSFNADITVDEARGKILVINATPIDNCIGINVEGWPMNNKTEEKQWTNAMCKLYDMGNGHLYVQDYNNAKYDKNRKDENGNSNDRGKYDLPAKETMIKNGITLAAADNSELNWYFNSAAYHNHGAGTFHYGDIYYGCAWKGTHNTGFAAVDGNPCNASFRDLVKTEVAKLSNGESYQRCGIILGTYVAEDNSADSFENTVWNNNYKANGPMRSTSK